MRLFRLATRFVPAAWRGAISRDLEDEARAARQGQVWLAWQAIRVALRLRWTIGGSAMMFDLRYAIRSLTHARWFAVGAILTFALGIGVNVAVFALLDRLLFRPLPYLQPSTLVVMIPSSGGQYYTRTPRPIVVDARGTPAIFSGVAVAGRTSALTIDPSGDGPQLRLTEATWHLLGVLGVRPMIGRGFSEADAIAKSRVALITYEAWQRSFGGAASILGRRIGPAPTPVEIVGVLPRDFTSPSPFLGPSDGLRLDPDRLNPGDLRDGVWPAVARLRPGVAVATAQAAVDAITARVSADLDPSGKRTWHIQVTSVRDALFHGWNTYLWLVAGAAAMVLLIACVNLSSLLLARGRSREQTLALCTALGATPGRLASAIFIEALVVAFAGAVVALGALVVTEHAIVSLEPAALGVYAVGVSDLRLLAITLGAALASAGAAAAWPSMSASRVDVQTVLQQGTKTGRRTRSVALRTLLAAEAAFGTILVVGALLAGGSLVGLLERDLGFVPHNVFVISSGLPFQEAAPAKMAFYARVREVLGHEPGVEAAGGVDTFTIGGNTFMRGFPSPSPLQEGGLYQVTGDYFEAIGASLLAGRTITNADVAHGALVAVVSRRGAQVLWPDATPAEVLGRIVRVPNEPDRTVVGVVADQRATALRDPVAGLFVPYGQASPELGPHAATMDIVARLRPGATVGVDALRRQLRGEFPQSTLRGQAGDDLMAPSLRQPKFQAMLFGAFAVTALVLAAVGLYAIASFDVSLRRYEMGVRMALGATAADVRREVVAASVAPIAMGVALGLVGSWWASELMASLLVDVRAHDPFAIVIAAATLVATAFAAAWEPARRAARADPAVVLRAQ